MKLLLICLKVCGAILGIALLLLGLTFLAWWMQWPLLTGVVLLLGLIGTVLVIWGIKALWRWHDKSKFVREVLKEQKSFAAQDPITLSKVESIFQQGYDILKHSNFRYKDSLEFSQPCYVTLDATAEGSQIFEGLAEQEVNGDGPLSWHFLTELVILRVQFACSPEAWQEFLAQITAKKMPVHGLLLQLDCATILSLSNVELAALGHKVRTKAQQLMLALNLNLPLYVVVEGLTHLSGIEKVLEIVPAHELSNVLGLVRRAGGNIYAGESWVGLGGAKDSRALGESHQDVSVSGSMAAESAKNYLEQVIQKEASAGFVPTGNILKSFKEIKQLGTNLNFLLDQVAKYIANQVTTSILGVVFCAAKNKANISLVRPYFLTGLFAYTLPLNSKPDRLKRGLQFVASVKALLLAGWLLALLALIGLFGVNVLYQQQAVTENSVNKVVVDHDPVLNKLYQQMICIQGLEKARNAWVLPTCGLNLLETTLNKAKIDFTEQVYLKILTPIFSDYRQKIATPNLSPQELGDIARQMRLFVSVAMNYSNPKKFSEFMGGLRFSSVIREWNPVTARLIANAVQWMQPGEQVETFKQEVRNLLADSLRLRGAAVLDDMIANINDRYPAAKVCLGQYWPHINLNDPNNFCVSSAYTTVGYKNFSDVLTDLELVDDNTNIIKQNTAVLRSTYFRRYAEQWLNFTKAFNNIRGSMQVGDVFMSYADLQTIEDMPHYRVMQKIGDEVVPLQDAGQDTPPWLANTLLIDMILDMADYVHREEATSEMRSILRVLTNPKFLQRLKVQTKNTQDARKVLKACEDVRRYFDDILVLLQTMASTEKSYALAQKWFGGPRLLASGKGHEDAKDSANSQDVYANAKKQLADIVETFKVKGRDPILELLPGLLDFIAQGVTVQAAKVVQDGWENDVVGSAVALYKQDDVTALFGPNGIVQTFVKESLNPFLKRKNKALTAAKWGDIEFPFTTDGLKALNQAEILAANPGQDVYFVQLRSQPTLVNVDAKERVDATRVTLQCQDKTYSLLNRNYPRDEKFQYTVKQCGATKLEINFPNFTLVKDYSNFVEFLEDFETGQQVFTEDDFGNAASKMVAAGIKEVKVRILPDNIADILRQQGHEPPTLPEKLTYVW